MRIDKWQKQIDFFPLTGVTPGEDEVLATKEELPQQEQEFVDDEKEKLTKIEDVELEKKEEAETKDITKQDDQPPNAEEQKEWKELGWNKKTLDKFRNIQLISRWIRSGRCRLFFSLWVSVPKCVKNIQTAQLKVDRWTTFHRMDGWTAVTYAAISSC